MSDYASCKHCVLDYADGYGGGYWFPEDCTKYMDMDADNCEGYEEEDSIGRIKG